MANDKNTKQQERPVSAFGAGNLKVEDTPDNVTIQFDPRVIIGRFNPPKGAVAAWKESLDTDNPLPEPIGNPKTASTGSYRTLDISGVRVMLHVIGRSDS